MLATGTHNTSDPPTLMAVLRAARLTGDRDLERAARRLLRDEHGIEVTFIRKPRSQEAPANAS
jgi:hypothetical protein